MAYRQARIRKFKLKKINDKCGKVHFSDNKGRLIRYWNKECLCGGRETLSRVTKKKIRQIPIDEIIPDGNHYKKVHDRWGYD